MPYAHFYVWKDALMYLEFFGLTDRPFKNTPDPAFFYSSKNHRKVLATLSQAIHDRCGLILLTGEIGTGKTTICHNIAGLTGLDSCYLYNPLVTELEFLTKINSDLGISCESSSGNELLCALRDHLERQCDAGQVVVIFVDEAHRLAVGLLEQILILSNLQRSESQLLQIVLSGQPELLGILRHPRLASLNQRIGVRCHLWGMNRSDTFRYINHRLDKAGCTIHPLFTPGSLEAIWRASRGTPRLINQLCDRALTEAYNRGKKRIAVAEVHRLSKDPLYRSLYGSTGMRWSWKAALSCVAIGLVLGGAFMFTGRIQQKKAGESSTGSIELAALTSQQSEAEPVIQDISRAVPTTPPAVIREVPARRQPEATGDAAPGQKSVPILANTMLDSEIIEDQIQESLARSGSTALPDIKLSAIAWDENQARRLVVINDKILHEGEFIGEVRVLRVHPEHVVLLYRNEHVIKRIHAEQ
jgi:general secretion pathway protein A